MKTEGLMSRFAGASPLLLLAATLMLFTQSGCGGDDAAPEVGQLNPDQQAISSLVGGVSDMASELDRLRESFTKASAPTSSQRKIYAEHMFDVAGDIVVTGDTASFPVQIMKYGTDTTIEKQWKAAKEDGVWKLSDTPLP